MPPKSIMKLSQEEFDEAVRTNIEDFDQQPEEAVASAVEEFKLQGYSLEGIILSSSGSNTDSHPIAIATKALAGAAAAAGTDSAQLPGLQAGVAALQQLFRGLSSSDLQQALAVAHKEGTVSALLAALKAAAGSDGPAPSAAGPAHAAQLSSLRTLRLLMQLPDCRADLLAGGGAEQLQELLRRTCGNLAAAAAQPTPSAAQQQEQYQLAAAVAALAEAASWQDEEGKCRFMDMGFAADLLQLLQTVGSTAVLQHATPAVAAAAAAAAGAAAGTLRAVTTADDARPPSSKAFLHARLLAGKPHHALQVLLPVLRQLSADPVRPLGPLIAVLGAVRQIAANDEICKAFSEDGGVAALQQLLGSATEAGPPELVRATAAALRQLANSDAIKAQLAQGGALPTLLRAARLHGSSTPAVQEQLLGLLVAMVLRMPDISAAAAEAGAVEVLTEVLSAAPAMAAAAKAKQQAGSGSTASGGGSKAAATANGASDKADDADVDELASRVFGVGISGNGSSNGSDGGAAVAAAVQRQACMALRNMVVRNPELRPPFLAAGAEPLLRDVRGLFPGGCKDVACAALRDLGLDNYQD